MSAELFDLNPIETLQSGLHIRRQAAGEMITRVSLAVEAMELARPGVEARHVGSGEKAFDTIGLNVMTRRETTSKRRLRSVPSERAVQAVLMTTPSLRLDHEVTIEDIEPLEIGKSVYITGIFREEDENALLDERSSICETLDRLSGHRNRYDWDPRRPDVTFAYVPEELKDSVVVDELVDMVGSFVPLGLTLRAADINDNQHHQK